MCLVDNHGAATGDKRSRSGRAAFLSHLEQLAGNEREFLQCGDDHRHRILERFGELARTLVDPLHDATLVFELVDRVLELLIEHDAIGDHDYAVEDALVGGVVQGREPMGQPTDSVALAAACRMLDEVVVAHALPARGVDQHPHRLKLVVAGEDHGFHLDFGASVVAFLVDLQVNEAGEDVEQAVALQHFFPQICRSVGPPVRIGRVPGRSRAPLVEGQEVRRSASQSGGHEYGFGVYGEMRQRAALEFEDWLARIAILLVLPPRIFDPLARKRIFQLHRYHWNTVQAHRDVERLLRTWREMELAGEPKTVGGVAGLKLRIQLVRRLKIRRTECSTVALEPVPQRRERAVSVHPLTQIAEHLIAGLVAV